MVKFVVCHWRELLLLTFVAASAGITGFWVGHDEGRKGLEGWKTFAVEQQAVKRLQQLYDFGGHPKDAPWANEPWSPLDIEADTLENHLASVIEYIRLKNSEAVELQDRLAAAESATEKLDRVCKILSEPTAKTAKAYKPLGETVGWKSTGWKPETVLPDPY